MLRGQGVIEDIASRTVPMQDAHLDDDALDLSADHLCSIREACGQPLPPAPETVKPG